MKKLLLSMLFLVGGVVLAQADELMIAGVTVNLNATSKQTITGSGITGSITYDPSEKRLDMTNATINCNTVAISADVKPGSSLPFRVYLSGKNTITTTSGTPVRADNDIMFCGNGDLDITGPQGMFICESKLTVYACRISINSTGNGIYGLTSGTKSDFELAYHGALYIKCTGTAMKNFNTIKYTTGALLSGSQSGTELMLGDNYKLEISENKVTPFNRDAVTGSGITGTVKVSLIGTNASTYTGLKLSLNNARVSGSNFGIDFNDPAKEFVVDVTGTNSVSATTRGITGNGGSKRSPMTIQGSGQLGVYSATGISHQGDVTIKDCNVSIDCSARGISLWNDGILTIDNAIVYAKGSSSSGAISNLNGITYGGGCWPIFPFSCTYNSSLKGLANNKSSDASLVSEVTIQPTYGIAVCGTMLTKTMGTTSSFVVSGSGIEGTVRYDPTLNILYLTNASLKRNAYDGEHAATIHVYDFNGDKTITGSKFSEFSVCASSGKNYINHTESIYTHFGVYSCNDLYFYGNGSLDLDSNSGIYLEGSGRYCEFAMNESGLFSNVAYSSAVRGDDVKLKFKNNKGTCRFLGKAQDTFMGITSVDMGENKWFEPSGATYSSSQKTIVVGSTPVKNQWVVVSKEAIDYGIDVFDKPITNLNYFDPDGDGCFAYDPITKTLQVLKTVTSSSYSNGINNYSVDGLTIDFVNPRTIAARYGVRTNKDLTITSSTSNKCTINALDPTGVGIYVREGAKLTIKNINLEVNGYWGIAGNASDPSVLFDKANVTAKSTGGGCVVDFGEIEFNGCGVKTPAGAQIKNKAICDASGNKIMDQVVISTEVSAIDAIEVANDTEVKAIYDAAGRQTTTAKRGLNIIRMSDGTIRKMMVK